MYLKLYCLFLKYIKYNQILYECRYLPLHSITKKILVQPLYSFLFSCQTLFNEH